MKDVLPLFEGQLITHSIVDVGGVTLQLDNCKELTTRIECQLVRDVEAKEWVLNLLVFNQHTNTFINLVMILELWLQEVNTLERIHLA